MYTRAYKLQGPLVWDRFLCIHGHGELTVEMLQADEVS
jgi:hypothetical protein